VSEQDCLRPSSSAAELICEWRTITEFPRQAMDVTTQHQDLISDVSKVSVSRQLPLGVFTDTFRDVVA
jgi:hypothetical protein